MSRRQVHQRHHVDGPGELQDLYRGRRGCRVSYRRHLRDGHEVWSGDIRQYDGAGVHSVRVALTSALSLCRILALCGDATRRRICACCRCPKGYQCPNGVNVTACVPGQYSNAVGAAACLLCTAGTFTAVVGMSSAAGCTLSPPGFYTPSDGMTAPLPCSRGRFASDSGLASCLYAYSGYYVSVSGATAQSPCPAGSWSCPVKHRRLARTRRVIVPRSVCFTPGSFCSWGATAPALCGAGTYSNTGASYCSSCGTLLLVPACRTGLV